MSRERERNSKKNLQFSKIFTVKRASKNIGEAQQLCAIMKTIFFYCLKEIACGDLKRESNDV